MSYASSTANLPSSYTRAPRVSWTPAYEKTFFESLANSVKRGLRDPSSGTLKMEAWTQAARDIQREHNIQLERNHLKNKADNARKRFKAWRGLRINPAFKYDEKACMVNASDEDWEAHLKIDPTAKPLRGRPFDHEQFFEIIFDDLVNVNQARKKTLRNLTSGSHEGTSVIDFQGTSEGSRSSVSALIHPNSPRQHDAHTQSYSHQLPTYRTSHSSASHSYERHHSRSPSIVVSHSVEAPMHCHISPPTDPTLNSEPQTRKRSLSVESSGSAVQRRRTEAWPSPSHKSVPVHPRSSLSSAAGSISAPPPPPPVTSMGSIGSHDGYQGYIHSHPPRGYSSHSHHHHHHPPRDRHRETPVAMATPPSTVGATSPSTSISQPALNNSMVSQSTAMIEEMLSKILQASQTAKPVSNWTEQALDTFFTEFSNEDHDLQLYIAEQVLVVEAKAMIFCKMKPELRRHWVRRHNKQVFHRA